MKWKVRVGLSGIIILFLLFLAISFANKMKLPRTIMDLEADWKIVREQNYNIYYTKDDEHIYRFSTSIKSVFDEVFDKFNKYKDNNNFVNIVVLSESMLKELDIQHEAGWNGDVIILSEDKIKNYSVTVTFRHELIHALTIGENFKLSNNIPGWLREGIAQYYQENISNDRLDKVYIINIIEAYQEEALISFKEMNASAGTWKLNTKLAYSQAASMYFYLINKYGENNIIKLFYSEGDFYTNLYLETGKEFEDIEKEWREYIISGN